MNDTVRLLCDLIRHPSVSGSEGEVMEVIATAFEPLVDELERIPVPPAIVADPDYSDPLAGLDYTGRFNLRLVLRGTGGGRSLIINTHADVVPASRGQEDAFVPRVSSGYVYGRGACDAKGQVASLWRALRGLRTDNVQLRGNLIVHIVLEEENGGNGTLALVRRGEHADAAVVLEPTGLKIVTSARGAVWFRIRCVGQAAHVGHATRSISALKSTIEVMEILQAYHDELLDASRGIALFDVFEDPMPIVFGKLQAGSWPATTPDQAQLEGVLGFLPNRTKEQVMAAIREAIEMHADPWTRENLHLAFTYRHDPLVTSPDAPVVQTMAGAIRHVGQDPMIAALPASSDAWFYGTLSSIPTILFGPGHLADAHTSEERIALPDLECGSETLRAFIQDWAG